MKRLIMTALLLATAATAPAADDDTDRKPSAALQFTQAQQLLSIADDARDKEKFLDAVKLYREALLAYTKLSKTYPDWQPGITQFRIIYCNNQLEALLKKVDNSELKEIAESGKQAVTTPPPIVISLPPATNTAPPSENIQAKIPVGPRPMNRDQFRRLKSEATTLVEKGDTEQARAIILDGLKADPDDRNMRMLMGLVHCKASEYENAVNLMESLIMDEPANPIAHVILGTAYAGMNNMKGASKHLEEALKINPRQREAHFNLAQIIMAGKNPDLAAAKAHYKTALELGCTADQKLNDRLLTQP